MNRSAVRSGIYRESVLKPIAPWLVGVALFLLLIHLTICGPCRRMEGEIKSEQPLVCRFKWHERFIHCLLMASFIILGVTGFFFLLGRNDPSGPLAREFHAWMGWIFMLSAVASFVIWVKHMIFRKGDEVWLRSFGGYFKKKAGLPAAKFNAGQKIFFWMISAPGLILSGTGVVMFFLRKSGTVNLSLVYMIHDLAAALFFPLLIIHMYLGLVINPETMRSIFGGYVRRLWLEEHHPEAEL